MQIASFNATTASSRTQKGSPAASEAVTGDRFDFKRDCVDQASWLAQECRARFNCTPGDLMKGPDGFERFSQLAAEWREAHPRD